MKEKLLTIAEIAKQLGLAESTVRFYRDKFSEYIPSKGDGKKKRYRPEALEVLRFIADSLRSGKTAEQTAEVLVFKFPREIKVAEQTAAIAAAEPQQEILSEKITDMIAIQTEALKQLTVILYKYYEQQRSFETFSNELQTLSDEVIFLRKKLDEEKRGDKKTESDQKIEDILTRLNQVEKNRTQDTATFNAKDKELSKAKAELSEAEKILAAKNQAMEQAGQKIKELQEEVERLKTPWLIRWFKKK